MQIALARTILESHRFHTLRTVNRILMPAISVLLDDELLVTVDTHGLDMLAVHVHGDRTDAGFAFLDVSGGIFPGQGESTHLWWLFLHPLQPGQRIDVRFDEEGTTLYPGKTSDELALEEPEEPDTPEPDDFRITPSRFAELRAQPVRRSRVSFRLQDALGMAVTGEMAAHDHGFGFNAVWHASNAEELRYSLHTYSLDNLEHKTPMRSLCHRQVTVPYALTLQAHALTLVD